VSASANPSPWTRPNPKVTATRSQGRPRPNRFPTATHTIEAAISGSTTDAGACTSPSTARESVMLWASVKAVTMPSTRQKLDAPINSASRNSRWS